MDKKQLKDEFVSIRLSVISEDGTILTECFMRGNGMEYICVYSKDFKFLGHWSRYSIIDAINNKRPLQS